MNELVKRQQATRFTLAKYGPREFKWGSCDCGKIAAFHARKFGWKPPKTGTYQSAVGAMKYLASLGVSDMPGMLDKIGFKEIPPAFAMMGDFVSFASDHPIGSIGIVTGNGNMACFHEAQAGLVYMTMTNIDRAWSIMRPSDV